MGSVSPPGRPLSQVPAMHTRSPSALRRLFIAALFGLSSTALVVYGADAVILPDGFVVQGKWFKETEIVTDSGRPIRMNKARGFDIVEDGPKFVVFSSHAQKGGRIEKDLARANFTALRPKAAYRLGSGRLPPIAGVKQVGEFDDKWKRQILVEDADHGKATQHIFQQVVSLDPYSMTIDCINFSWRVAYHTAEQDPKLVRHLLAVHPDLKDPPDKVDPDRRLKIAAFLNDVGWPAEARKELDKLKKDAPGPWGKDATEHFEKVREAIDLTETRLAIDYLEAITKAGQYGAAKRFLANFSPRSPDAKEKTRLSILRVDVEEKQTAFDKAVPLLRRLIERESGLTRAWAFAALGGGPAVGAAPVPKLTPELRTLLDAGRTILGELHPDSVSRIGLFTDLAGQDERQRSAGKPPTAKPAELLAVAITGWLKGKNGADPNAASALRYWSARQVALACLREPIGNNRRILLDDYLKAGKPLGPDEFAQIIALLPPPEAEDLGSPGGKPVPVDEAGVPGVYRRNSGPSNDLSAGADYCLRLPAEYHHGRAYPVILALSSPTLPAAKMVGLLAPFADRHGYIVAAPEWTTQFSQPYDFSGKEHPLVRDTLRDLTRHFRVDSDRVFLYGFGDGANFALDVGLAHPDLFAGLIANGANPPASIYRPYWHNAQKLPVYMIAGELTGTFPNLRVLYTNWMPRGFPALLTIYKGRGGEWFGMELPRVFDWMGRKTRVRGAGSLRLNKSPIEAWQVLRETDNRFYWVGVGEGGLPNGNKMANWQPGRLVNPAQFKADIVNGTINLSNVRNGIRKIVIWLERDLIDWNQPVRVNINGSPAIGYRPKKLEPDLNLMFDELYRTGDRKMLFFGKLEFAGRW
jgi:hypothetical protein